MTEWCGPGWAIAPEVEAAYNQYKGGSVDIKERRSLIADANATLRLGCARIGDWWEVRVYDAGVGLFCSKERSSTMSDAEACQLRDVLNDLYPKEAAHD